LIIDVLFSEFIEHCAQDPTQHVVLILKKHTSKKNLTLLGLRPRPRIYSQIIKKQEFMKKIKTYFFTLFSA